MKERKDFRLLYNIYAVGDWFRLINKYITFIETKRGVHIYIYI